MKPYTARVRIDRNILVAAGNPPFLVDKAGDQHWIVTGRDGGNCLAFPDGIRAVFDEERPAVLLCRELNDWAAR